MVARKGVERLARDEEEDHRNRDDEIRQRREDRLADPGVALNTPLCNTRALRVLYSRAHALLPAQNRRSLVIESHATNRVASGDEPEEWRGCGHLSGSSYSLARRSASVWLAKNLWGGRARRRVRRDRCLVDATELVEVQARQVVLLEVVAEDVLQQDLRRAGGCAFGIDMLDAPELVLTLS